MPVVVYFSFVFMHILQMLIRLFVISQDYYDQCHSYTHVRGKFLTSEFFETDHDS